MATTLKVVLLGDAGVGKTSIFDQFINGIFNPLLDGSLSAQFMSKIIEFEELNHKIKLDIWDTAGARKFRFLSKIFYKDANVICLCYDTTSRSSFEELKDYWYEKEIKINVNQDPILIVVANKNDLYDLNEIKDEEGKAFAEEINAIFQSISAKSNIGIKSLFENIVRKYFDPSYDYNEIEKREKRRKKQQNVYINI